MRTSADDADDLSGRRRAVWLVIAAHVWIAPLACAYDYDAPFANTGGAGGNGGAGGSQADGAGTEVGGAGGDAATTDQSGGGSGGDAATPDHELDQASDSLGDGPVEDQIDGQTDAETDDAAECPVGHGCVPRAPSPWSGPFALRESEAPGPTCTGAYDELAFALHAGLQPAADATCSTCTCGPVTGQTCRMDLDLFQTDDCTGMRCVGIDSPGTWCDELNCSGDPPLGSIRFGSHISGTGSCGASPQDAGVEALSWKVHAALCAADALLACPSDSVCLPAVSAPFEPELCVARNGSHPCDAPYTQRRDYYAGSTDTRTCTPCICGAPQGGSCEGAIQLSIPGPTCGGPGIAYPAQGYCLTLSPPETSAAIIGPLSLSGASCAPSGGQPTGSAWPSDHVTVCCLP